MAAKRDQLVRGKRRHAPITITEHAVDRFHARHCPEESRAKARALLKAAAASAVHLREKTGAGQERWQTEDGIILVVKRDPALRSAVVVTALPRGDHWDEDPLDGEGDADPEISTYGEPCPPGTGKPLRVTARLAEGIVLRAPLMLDGLLAWAVSAEHRLLPPVSGQRGPTIEIPIEREPGGRFHLCSQGLHEVEASELRHKNRRAPVMEMARLGSSKISRVQISVGANKSYRVPYALEHLRDNEITWYCIGDPERIMSLLRHVHYLGRHRGAGKGRLDLHGEPWRVEECEPWGDGFPVVDVEGQPMRRLPPEHPGLAPGCRLTFGTLTYPYYDYTRQEMVACPSGLSTTQGAGYAANS